jgi:ribA/ribD-fused uncharacterized protein
MTYSLQWLQQQVQDQVPHEYFFFWGHTQKQEGIIDKSCLSQWYPLAFIVDGIAYPTAEHWMMAKKALLFNDAEAYEQVLTTAKPGAAKAIGRKVKNFDVNVWQKQSFDIVIEGSFHKFSQHELLKQFYCIRVKKLLWKPVLQILYGELVYRRIQKKR